MVLPTLQDRSVGNGNGNGNGNGVSDNENKKRKTSLTQAGPYGHYNQYKDTNTSMVKSKFLSNPEDLGVVAVGFSGGQVRPLSSICFPLPFFDLRAQAGQSPRTAHADNSRPHSASQASTPPPRP